jgi:hypothetical protein
MLTKEKHPAMDMIYAIFTREVGFFMACGVRAIFTPLNTAGLDHINERVGSAPLTGVPEVD